MARLWAHEVTPPVLIGLFPCCREKRYDLPMNTAPSQNIWQPLLEDLRRMRTMWPTRGFSWDERFSCIASSFSVQVESEARAAIREALPHEWTAVTIAKGPAYLQEVALKSGGVRSNQLVFASGSHGGVFSYGLWWPWENGQTISLRLGLGNVKITREPFPRFRELFGVPVGS